MKAYVFPGQGSQFKGMGEALFSAYPEITVKASEVLGYDIAELCIYDYDNKLGNTRYTQPALYTVNYLYYLEEVKKNGKPDIVAGHSLGEFNALCAAGVFDFETGLRIVKMRAELMSCVSGGGMAAVLSMNVKQVEDVLKRHAVTDAFPANINTQLQTVISGTLEAIEQCSNYYMEAGASFIPLNVSGAFHSPFMKQAGDELRAFAQKFEFRKPELIVISNFTAREYHDYDILDNLINQISSPVKWDESVHYIMEYYDCKEIFQVGPGEVLRGMLPKIAAEEAMFEKKIEEKRYVRPEQLGSKSFRERYGLKYAYVAGAMYRGISSAEMTIKMAREGFMCFFGSGGIRPVPLREAFTRMSSTLGERRSYGVNILYNPEDHTSEDNIVDLALELGIHCVEAAAYLEMSESLARYKILGLRRDEQGHIISENRIIAKLSRPEVAECFARPIPDVHVRRLLEKGVISAEQAEMAAHVPGADDITVESDSGGHTDGGVPLAVFPYIRDLCRKIEKQYGYYEKLHIGAGGGIGTPEGALAYFVMGADYIVTGSVNQCTVEADISNAVKNILAGIGCQDTDYAPAGDVFGSGALVQVVKRGLLFPPRARKLYDLYLHYNSLDEIPENVKKQLEDKYFHKSLEQVYEDSRKYYTPEEQMKNDSNPKSKMRVTFKAFFPYTTHLAMDGNMSDRLNFQINCGPAMGSFNMFVVGTEMEKWQNRHVTDIANMIMEGAAEMMNNIIVGFCDNTEVD